MAVNNVLMIKSAPFRFQNGMAGPGVLKSVHFLNQTIKK